MNLPVILWVALSLAWMLRQTQLSFRRMLARVPIRVRCEGCGHDLRAPLGALQAFKGVRGKDEGGIDRLLPCLAALARLDKTLSSGSQIFCRGCRKWRSCTLLEPGRVSLAVRRRMAQELGPHAVMSLMGAIVLGIVSWLLGGMAFLLA